MNETLVKCANMIAARMLEIHNNPSRPSGNYSKEENKELSELAYALEDLQTTLGIEFINDLCKEYEID